jgi:hypothetical protein
MEAPGTVFGIAVRAAMPLYIRERNMRFWLAAAIGVPFPTQASAQPAVRRVVGECFTSEGCSSYPPRDAMVAALARTRPDLLLPLHVTDWNNPGWHNPCSFAAATQQRFSGTT